MNARCRLAVALICVVALAPRAIGEEPKPKGIEGATAQAWSERGFEAGWKRERGGQVWLTTEYPKGTEGAVPALWPRDFGRAPTDESLKDLPVVEVPFALHLHWRNELTDTGLKYLTNQKKLTALNLGSAKITDEGLKHLAALSNLNVLKLSGDKITNAGLKQLADVKSLTTVVFAESGVTDAGLKELARLENLSVLGVVGPAITDAGLAHLTGSRKLTDLYLWKTGVTDAGLEHLAGLTELRVLFLLDSAVTGEKLGALANMRKLNHLGLGGNRVTGRVLQTMSEMGLLHALPQAEAHGGTEARTVDGRRPTKPEEVLTFNLIGTRATGDGLKYLAALPNLTNVYLDSAQVEGLQHLLALKNLAVLHLRSDEVTGARLKPLAGARSLAHLSLPLTDETLGAVYEAGVIHLLREAGGADGKRPATPDEVVSFDLSRTQVQGEGLKYAGKLKNLATLNLSGLSVRREWLEDFQRTRPKCKIIK
jgi:hypothetical protein